MIGSEIVFRIYKRVHSLNCSLRYLNNATKTANALKNDKVALNVQVNLLRP